MAKPSAGRGGSSDEEGEDDPETIAEMNRIMGRDKPPKQTSSGGMSLAERAQARMKAAQGARKDTPGHASHVSSLTQHVPHNFGSSSSSSHHGHSTSTLPSKAHPSAHPSSHHPPHTQPSGGAGHHATPSVSTNHGPNSSPSRKGKTLALTTQTSSKDLFAGEPSHLISSPLMRNMPPPVSSNHHPHPSSSPSPPPPPDDESHPHIKSKSKVPESKNPQSPPSPTLAEHYRTLSVGPPSMKEHTKPPDDDIELEPPDIDEDEEENEKSKKKKKKKKGFFGKLKKAVGKKKDKDKDSKDSDSESEEETEQEAKEMQADIDRIMRGKVAKPGAPPTTATTTTGGKGLSLQERAALAQKRAAGKS